MAKKNRKDPAPDKESSKTTPPSHQIQPQGNSAPPPLAQAADGAPKPEAAPPPKTPLPIVAIGSSAGGLEALQEFFSKLPPESGIGFVVVTHVRPGRESMLADLLGAVTSMKVIHAGDYTPVLPNQVIVARDALLTVSNGVIRPLPSEVGSEVSYHPIDQFFRSLAEDQKEHAIGIVLSGSGNDGSLGVKAIKAVGGMVMAQAPASAKYASMPESAISTHLADYVLPPNELPAGRAGASWRRTNWR